MINKFLTGAALCLSFASSAFALDFKVVNSKAIPDETFYEFGLLKLALEKADGDHTLVAVDAKGANQSRLSTLLEEGGGAFNVIYTGINKERYAALKTVPIPLQRGLLGHRLLITNADAAERVAAVETLEQLQELRIGSGTGWPDTEILRQAGLTVSAAAYDNLFTMVDRGRIDGYARGAAEPFSEVSARSESHPNLQVDEAIMIVYPFDVFFFVAPGDQERHDIILQGLQRAYEDGSFMEYFNSHPQIQDVMAASHLDARRRFDLENPLLPQAIADLPDHLWYGR